MTEEIKPPILQEIKKEDSHFTLLDQAQAIAERQEKANIELDRLLKKQEEFLARQILGGKSEAGIQEKKETEDERIKRETMELFKGTGLNPFK